MSQDTLKIRLANLPRFVSSSMVKKYLGQQLKVGTSILACRKAPKWDYALVTFKGTTAGLIEELNGMQWKNKRLVAKPDTASNRSYHSDRSDHSDQRNINDQVTPLWRMPYEEQLGLKQQAMEKVVCQINPALKPDPIRPSPLPCGYRNKCEFTVGFDRTGLPSVGFTLGGFRQGLIAVESADDCLHVPEVFKRVASYFQEWVRRSGVPVYDRISKTGFWRLLLVRVHGGQLMAMVQVTASYPDLGAHVASLSSYLASFSQEPSWRVDSFYVQATDAVFHGIDPQAPCQPVFGVPHVYEQLQGLRFQISPLSFFQVNISATVLLYETIRSYLTLSATKAVLLDLCCGTGTIGMIAADSVERVVGVELVREAIRDAEVNASLNNIPNIAFKCGKVEDLLPGIIDSISPDQEIVVILDPPRSGVRNPVCVFLPFLSCLR